MSSESEANKALIRGRIADGKIRERWASIDTAAAQPARASAA